MAEQNGEIIAGKNPVLEALRSGRDMNKVWIAEGVKKSGVNELLDLARERGVIVQFVPKKKVDQLSSANHQGIVASVAAYKYAELEDLFAAAAHKQEDPFFLILDELEDPHNLGSIIRTAELSGAHGIIIPKRRNVGLTPVVYKAAAGALEHMLVAKVTNINSTIEALKKNNIWVYGAHMEGESCITADLSGAVALVIGSEGKGISKLTKEKCDKLIKIPMVGEINSLNASVAAGIIMYEVMKTRL